MKIQQSCNQTQYFCISVGMQKKFKLLLFIFISILIFSTEGLAQVIRGKITAQNGEPVPFVSVYLKNSTFGVSANLKGEYQLFGIASVDDERDLSAYTSWYILIFETKLFASVKIHNTHIIREPLH